RPARRRRRRGRVPRLPRRPLDHRRHDRSQRRPMARTRMSRAAPIQSRTTPAPTLLRPLAFGSPGAGAASMTPAGVRCCGGHLALQATAGPEFMQVGDVVVEGAGADAEQPGDGGHAGVGVGQHIPHGADDLRGDHRGAAADPAGRPRPTTPSAGWPPGYGPNWASPMPPERPKQPDHRIVLAPGGHVAVTGDHLNITTRPLNRSEPLNVWPGPRSG